LRNIKNSIESVKSHNEDETSQLQQADIAQIAIGLSRQQALYQMSLSVAGKMMSLSLLDYID
jgi:flagellin-like hook-associated protein FlgL